MTDAEMVEWWEERAAIREYCGGMDRQRANALAAIELKRKCGTVPQVIVNQVRNGVQLEQQRKLFED